MSGWQYAAPAQKRRSWLRRHRIIAAAAAAAVALVILGVARTALSAAGVAVPGVITPGRSDYRDPAQLAEAVKSAEHAAAASCAKLPAAKYFCSVAFTDHTSGSYQVTVSADGKSYTAS